MFIDLEVDFHEKNATPVDFAVEGGLLKLTTEFSGAPVPVLLWYKDGQLLNMSHFTANVTFAHSKGGGRSAYDVFLSKDRATLEDGGLYQVRFTYPGVPKILLQNFTVQIKCEYDFVGFCYIIGTSTYCDNSLHLLIVVLSLS